MREQILNDLKDAMKAQDKEKLTVIRMVKGAMQLEELNKKRELNEEEVIDIISKQIKLRKESITEFQKGNRADLVAANEREIAILETYMPEQLTEEEIKQIVDIAFQMVQPKAIADMGKLMGIITPQVKGKADLGIISKTVRQRLQEQI